MPIPQSLPDTLLAELGKVTAIWANVEQDLVLHASAMAAYHTNGKPVEYLRMDFKRLREKWFSLCRNAFPAEVINRSVNTLNSNLAKLSLERGHYVHGIWSRVGRGRYRLSYWEQKASLEFIEGELTLRQIRTFVAACHRTSIQLHRFCTGEHGTENRYSAFSEVTVLLVPRDQG